MKHDRVYGMVGLLLGLCACTGGPASVDDLVGSVETCKAAISPTPDNAEAVTSDGWRYEPLQTSDGYVNKGQYIRRFVKGDMALYLSRTPLQSCSLDASRSIGTRADIAAKLTSILGKSVGELGNRTLWLIPAKKLGVHLEEAKSIAGPVYRIGVMGAGGTENLH